jgi:hypothetical protein
MKQLGCWSFWRRVIGIRLLVIDGRWLLEIFAGVWEITMFN